MAINKLITSEGNVQFIFGDTGKIINVHPFHIYTTFNEDTVSFILIGLPKSSGLAIFTSKAEDLEVNGEIYSFDDLPDALADAFAIAGAQMRYEVVDELPETGQTNTIYLVPKQGGSGFDEYIYVRDTGEWELIGDTDIELARYMKKEDFNAYSAATKLKIDYISGATDYVSGAVDTEISRATSAETELQTAIDNEISARTAAIEAIEGEISGISDSLSAYSTTVEMNAAIDAAVSGKVDTSTFNTALSGKQDTLVSGTNIKTINNESILGSGNIDIQGGGVNVVQTTGTSTTDVMSQDAVTTQLNGTVKLSNVGTNFISSFKSYTNSLQTVFHRFDTNNITNGGRIWYGKINDKYTCGFGNSAPSDLMNLSVVETSAITTSVTSSSTDAQVPSAKAVYDAIQEGGGGSSYTAGDGIDITNDVISVTGKVNTSDFETYSGTVESRIAEDEEVTSAGLNALNDKFGGLKLMKITQAAYDALTVKDNNTLYIISD